MTTDSTPDTDLDAVDEDESLTGRTDARWTYLGSLLAVIIIGTFLVLAGASVFGYATLATMPDSWFYVLALLVLTAGGWTFGADLADMYRNK